MKKIDYFIISILLFVGCLGLFLSHLYNSEGDIVCLYQDGKLVSSYSMSEDKTINIYTEGSLSNVAQISNGKICMTIANCPDKVCVSQGYINKNNESICCAPNKIILIVKSDEEEEYDAISQ